MVSLSISTEKRCIGDMLYSSLFTCLNYIFMLLNNRQVQTTYKYSDIVNYFAEEQVSAYKLDLGSGEMILTIQEC